MNAHGMFGFIRDRTQNVKSTNNLHSIPSSALANELARRLSGSVHGHPSESSVNNESKFGWIGGKTG